VTPNEDFYIRTEFPDQIDEAAPWSISIGGLVSATLDLALDDLLAMDHVTEVVCLECSGNSGGSRFGLMSAAEFSGVPLADVLELVDVDPSATMVLVSGFDSHSHISSFSTPGASWTFTFEQVAEAGGMLVTQMNGEPLPRDHGQPVRLLMPGWYGCCNAKWVDEIRLVDDSEPATAQMQEYASRTHQSGVPALAKDYVAATMDQAAMVTRVEKWSVDGEILYKLVGIMWGGYDSTDKLVMELAGVGTGPVEVCPEHSQNRTWTLWGQAFSPPETGQYVMSMRIDDPAVTTKRLDSDYYTRAVVIDEI
jgi:DMSO/TMAO reductase YedYZ molybdopterin-dependent catalytic subunit